MHASKQFRRFAYFVPSVVPIVVAGVLFAFGRNASAAIVAAIGLTLLLLAAVAPPVYERATDRLRRAGVALGHLFSQVVLTIAYVVVFVPAGLIARFRGVDSLAIAPPRQSRTLFVEVPIQDDTSLFERQFVREANPRLAAVPLPCARLLRLAAITLIAFVLVDFGAWTAIRHAWFALTGPPGDDRTQTAPYQGTDWGDDYWKEFREAFSIAYRPYVGWQRRDYNGEHITIANGIRSTWSLPSANDERARVFVFGGSTAWGTGARDEGTLPSWLARISHENGHVYEVVNFGESGFVSWQEALLLAELCASGQVPDVALFYDGVNDVFARLQSPEEPRPPQNLARSSRWFSAFRDKYTPLNGLAVFYQRNSLLFSVLRSAATPSFVESERIGPEGIARLVADEQAQTRAFVRAIADAYGFEAIHVWQPSVFTKEPLTDEEKIYERQPGKLPRDLLALTYRRATLAMRVSDEVIDASDALDGVDETVFIDWMHISEDGNRRVAQLIVDELASRSFRATP